jgi:hypothetical protein
MTKTLEVMTDTPTIAPPGKLSKMAKPAPSLPRGNDAEVASELRRLVSDAESGLRRILIAGFFIDRIAAELPHGAFRKWLDSHCPDVTCRTVERWRELAKNVADACGIKSDTRVAFDLPGLLAMRTDDVPEAQSEMRSKLDEMIEGKSFRQLVFGFKQAEEGEDGKMRGKPGRRPGEGGRQPAGTLSEQLALAREVALSDWDQIDLLVTQGYRSRFALLDDHRINAQIATLELGIKARRVWLSTPPERRTGDTTAGIEALFGR